MAKVSRTTRKSPDDNIFIHTAPGKSFEEYKKEHPHRSHPPQERKVRVLRPGEPLPYGPGVPGRGNTRG